MIITISAKAEHGKDFAATILKQKLETEGKKVLITHYADLVKYIAKQYFDWDGNKDEEGRTLLQWIGTEKVRSIFPNFWIDFIKDVATIFQNDYDYFIIPDCRFPNEIDLWKEDGWDIVALHIERLNYENHLTQQQRLHPSETSLDDYRFDYYIKTVSGAEHLEQEVDKFVEYLGGCT